MEVTIKLDRESLINILNSLNESAIDAVSGPNGFLGPQLKGTGSIEEWVNFHNTVYDTIDFEDLDGLLDILKNPPEMRNVSQVLIDDFKYVLIEAIYTVARRNALISLKKITPLLQINKIRSDVISIIGGIQHQEGITVLEGLMIERNLNDGEIISLSQALAEIKETKSRQVLEIMKIKFSNRNLEVLDEIENSLRACQN